jgi:hypothetical protein
MKKTTKCECPLAGYCNRHQVQKTPHMHKLCENHQGYFELWENCKGPGQDQAKCEKNETTEPQQLKKEDRVIQYPSKLQMAKNLAKSTVKHIANGRQIVSEEIQAERMSICAGTEDIPACEYYDKNSNRCKDCGCALSIKTKWTSSNCPQGKW